MSLLIGWDSICRICLKEGDLSPIFDGDEDVSAKIMLCSSIEVGKKIGNFVKTYTDRTLLHGRL